MQVTVKLSEWYADRNCDIEAIDYAARLLTDEGLQCCLGFCAEAHGVSRNLLLGKSAPSDIAYALPDQNWMESGGMDSNLALLAMRLNDGTMDGDFSDWNSQPLEVRMGNLITVFAEGGDDLEFVP